MVGQKGGGNGAAPKNGEDIESGKKKIAAKAQLPETYSQARDRLAGVLHTKVAVTCTSKGKGKISIPFNNEQDFEKLMEILDQLKQEQ